MPPALLTGVLTGALAALAAWLLTGQVRAYVPADAWYLRGRVHVALAAAGGLGAGAVAGSLAEAAAFGAAAVGCSLLVVVDLAVRRLPDRLVAATALALLGLLLVAAATGGTSADWGRAVLAGLALAAGYFVLAFLSPAGLGLGDVKFAVVVGAFLGWFGWQHVAVGTLLGFVLNAVVAVAVLVSGRGGRTAQVPFGPSMVAGAVAAVAVLG